MLEPQPQEFFAPFKLARQSQQLRGQMAMVAMARLAGLLAVAPEEKLEFELNFGVDEQGTSFVHGNVKAVVSMTCQRCGDPVAVTVESPVAIAFVTSEEEANRLPEGLEPYLVVEDRVILADLLEDELILALPIVATHPEQTCNPWFQRDQTPAEAVEEKRPSPFSVLEQLKRH
ncbi:MAG: DUF177 domain-containing protein [Gammaproteobacteria bacterium]|nr:DUF177 domain-containing protein [Gammaproteobacteria bacterium]